MKARKKGCLWLAKVTTRDLGVDTQCVSWCNPAQKSFGQAYRELLQLHAQLSFSSVRSASVPALARDCVSG
eukprot:4315361-Amphidinium_carterae.1